MGVDQAFKVLRETNEAITDLIKLGCKIDAHEHPQQSSLVFSILQKLDDARIEQIKVTKDYRKTAARLGETRRLVREAYSPGTLGIFYDSLNGKVIEE